MVGKDEYIRRSDIAFDEADGIACEAFKKICKVFQDLGENKDTQTDFARTVMEKWS